MTKNYRTKNGSVLVIIVVIALLGALGYVVRDNFFAPKNETVKSNENNHIETKAEYKAVKISGRNFRYPVNENNEKVIVVSNDSTPALKVSYLPIRNYYASRDVSDDCKSYVAGLVNANTEKEIMDHSYISRFYGKSTFEDALADGTVVQVGTNDLYLGGPFKQNEPCSDIYENKDQELQNIFSELKSIRLEWLKSLELVT